MYQQRVLKCADPLRVYGPLEEAILQYIIPIVTGAKALTPAERAMLSLPVREGEMAIDDPTATASSYYKNSVDATHIIQALNMGGG